VAGVSRHRLVLALCLALLLVSRSASAEFTTHSFTVPPGHVEITGMPARPSMVALDLSKDSDLTPFHLPLHVYFGVSDKLTLGITHEVGPFYRYGGPCFNCNRAYNDVGLGILYQLVRSAGFELDLHLDAPEFLSFEPTFLAVRGGVLGRVNIGSVVAIVFDPSLQIGLTRRPANRGNNKDYLWLPAWFYFQVTRSVAPFVGTGVGGRLEGFFDGAEVPLELGCIGSLTDDIDLGGYFQFNNLLGSGGSADWRQIGMLGRFRF
jgi:hypothetical protein